MKKIILIFIGFVLFALGAIFLFQKSPSSQTIAKREVYKANWDMIVEKGQIRVITAPSSEQFLARDGAPTSFEIDVACNFANENGLDCIVIESPSYDSILPWLQRGIGDIAAASLTVTTQRSKEFIQTRPVKMTREYLVGRYHDTISQISQLNGKKIAIRKNSSYKTTFDYIKDSLNINIELVEVPAHIHTEEIIYKISQNEYEYTFADSDIANAALSYMDSVKIFMPVSDYRDVAWFMRKGCETVKEKLDSYLGEFAVLGELSTEFFGDFADISRKSEIRFATRNNAASYWIYRGREVGFDYDLMSAFAKKHNLKLRIIVANSRSELFELLNSGRADVAAATITKTDSRQDIVDFSQSYITAHEVVVTAANSLGKSSVKQLSDLEGKEVVVRKNSSYEETLKRVKEQLGIEFNTILVDESIETEQILWKVAQGEYEVTICDDYLAFIELNHGRNLAIGPNVSQQREIAWAIRQNSPELKAELDDFFTNSDYRPKSLNYNILYNRYFKTESRNQKIDQRADIQNELSQFDDIIKKYSQNNSFDWRFIAAQIYQESKFDPNAQSWVGALGLMQLMPATARQFISGDITNPSNNVYAGTKYMGQLINRFDKSWPSNERFNFALASYNAGYGHVLDARRLATQKGWNPDVWFGNVEQAMLLLSQPKYYRQARYGYSRGHEPVDYVNNITNLFDSYRQVVD